MSLYVRIEDGVVKDCWNKPPDDREGWRSAIEVRPTAIPHRQYYTAHTFDLTKDPVEIVYGVADVTVAERKEQMKQQAEMPFKAIFRKQTQFPDTYDPVALQAAQDDIAPKQAAIDACTTHDELDALM
jgi:hypothetical protein